MIIKAILKKGISMLAVITVLALLAAPAAYCEQNTWVCPVCGRTDNTGNFCGSCASPSPTPVPVITETPDPFSNLSTESVEISNTSFPDGKFRNYVAKAFDLNGDKVLSEEEILGVTAIDCSGKYIGSLKGIEYFTALRELNCSNNLLSALDVSENRVLQHLNCNKNKLSVIDLQNNLLLQYVDVYHNKLTLLDLSRNTELTEIRLSDNKLTELNISCHRKLETLYANSNLLTSLDTGENTNLRHLECASNKIETLDLENNPALERLRCYGNPMKSIDIRSCGNLLTAWNEGELVDRTKRFVKLYRVPDRNDEVTKGDVRTIRDTNYYGIYADDDQEFIVQ